MKQLLERIRTDAQYVGKGIIKLDSFLNHQVDPALTQEMANTFVELFGNEELEGVTKIVSAEVSGIPAALLVAQILQVPMLYARKHKSALMTDVYYMAQAQSRTKGAEVSLMISKKYLTSADKVLVIDDFLATGSTLTALCTLIVESGAELRGIGCVIEKPQERGRDQLQQFAVPIVTLAKISWQGDELQLES